MSNGWMTRRLSDRLGLWYPDDFWIICPSFVPGKVPVLGVTKPFHMAIQKHELCSAGVQIGMHIVFLRHRRELSVVEQPHRRHRLRDGGEPHLIAGADAVDMLIQAVMK